MEELGGGFGGFYVHIAHSSRTPLLVKCVHQYRILYLQPRVHLNKGGTSQPAPLRRSERQRWEPSRLAVRWGTSYE